MSILFEDNFENGLSKWYGQGNFHYGKIIEDPDDSTNHILVFTGYIGSKNYGAMYSESLTAAGRVIICTKYKGLGEAANPYLGWNDGVRDVAESRWLASSHGYPGSKLLLSTNKWEYVSSPALDITGNIRVVLEGDAPYNAFYDDVVVIDPKDTNGVSSCYDYWTQQYFTKTGKVGIDDFVYSDLDQDMFILNFDSSEDKINLSTLSSIKGIRDLNIQFLNDDTEISAGGNGKIVIKDFNNTLIEANFVFNDQSKLCTIPNKCISQNLNVYDSQTQGTYFKNNQTLCNIRHLFHLTITGTGGRDEFMYINTDRDIVFINFDSSEDKINLKALTSIQKFADLDIDLIDGNTEIRAGGSGRIILKDFTGNLADSDFVFADSESGDVGLCNTQAKYDGIGSDSFWSNIVSGLVGTAVGGIISVAVFFCKRKYFPEKNVSPSTSARVGSVPIGIDLDEDGIDLVSFDNSTVTYDYNKDGILEKTSWVGNSDAILVYDHNDNGNVDSAEEFVLTNWCNRCNSDFEALLTAFDSDGDKIFNIKDELFEKFYLWQDKNQNGVSESGEMQDLKEAGLKYIDFNSQEEVADNPYILRTALVYWESGKVTNAYDLVLYHD